MPNCPKCFYGLVLREHLLKKRKENYEANKAEKLKQQVVYRQNNKILRRINHLRFEQKLLALKLFEFEYIKPLEGENEESLLTFVVA